MDTGINQSTISKYETGETIPTVENLILLADYYDTSLDYLMDRTNVIKKYPRTTKVIWSNESIVFHLFILYIKISSKKWKIWWNFQKEKEEIAKSISSFSKLESMLNAAAQITRSKSVKYI